MTGSHSNETAGDEHGVDAVDAGERTLDATVVICAYTFDRLTDTIASAESALAQVPAPRQVVVVVDHDNELLDCLRAGLPTQIEVVPNACQRGLSGARNSGIARAAGRIVVFLDDDATARAGWLAGLTSAFDDPTVLVAGGHTEPSWDSGSPGWFPPEFLWVVGCSYEGMQREGTVRNPLGCNMAVRADVFEAVGGFDPAVGRSATVPLGGDETELSIRARRLRPDGRVAMVDGAIVEHRVTRPRRTLSYFIRRCFYEGISKAALRRLEGGAALESERRYTFHVLPRAFVRNLAAALRLDRSSAHVGQALAIVAGLAVTTAGFVVGYVRTIGRGAPAMASADASIGGSTRTSGSAGDRPAMVAVPMGESRHRPRVVRAAPLVVVPPKSRRRSPAAGRSTDAAGEAGNPGTIAATGGPGRDGTSADLATDAARPLVSQRTER